MQWNGEIIHLLQKTFFHSDSFALSFLDEKGGIVETPLEDMEGEAEREKNHRYNLANFHLLTHK